MPSDTKMSLRPPAKNLEEFVENAGKTPVDYKTLPWLQPNVRDDVKKQRGAAIREKYIIMLDYLADNKHIKNTNQFLAKILEEGIEKEIEKILK